MRELLEGSKAVAKTIAFCRPKVISAYPITPQTHIVEELAQFVAEGKLKAEFVRAESEFGAASIVLGASQRGVRTYTATSSQGLLLMTEVLFNIAGLRLPVVLTCANRALSAPINIWNDWQDALTLRDSGWVMFFGENLQEVVDFHILAYKIAEKLNLPVMVNMDGFLLTHTAEVVEIPEEKLIEKFLGPFKPSLFLDPKNPKTFGFLADPDYYQEFRLALHQDLLEGLKKIVELTQKFNKFFGRNLKLIEGYNLKKAETVFVTMGSLEGTVKTLIDDLKSKKIGLIGIKLFRPFPTKIFAKLINPSIKRLIVLNKAVSLGVEGILTSEIKRAIFGKRIEIKDEILGLGGRDIKREDLIKLI